MIEWQKLFKKGISMKNYVLFGVLIASFTVQGQENRTESDPHKHALKPEELWSQHNKHPDNPKLRPTQETIDRIKFTYDYAIRNRPRWALGIKNVEKNN